MSRSGSTAALLGAIMGASVLAHGTVANSATAGATRAVVELFTSQGCSSCPPADAVAGRLLTDPAVIVLSFHVNYWDDLGWKDPFASQPSTDRQYAYARSLGERSVFTPQLILNGTLSLIGSQERAIRQAVAAASQAQFPVHADLAKQSDGDFALSLGGTAPGAKVWEVRYVRRAITQIQGGENRGRTLETYNNVTHMQSLGTFAPGTLKLPPLTSPDDGLAVIIQASSTGRILGAAAY